MGLMIAALVLHLGLGAESLAWALIFLIQPLSGVLPDHDAARLAATDRLDAALGPDLRRHARGPFSNVLRTDLLAYAIALNVAWMALAVLVFLLLFRSARNRGLLLQVGE